MMTTTPSSTVPTDVPHAVPTSRDLALEIAAVAAALQDARRDKRAKAQEFTVEIKRLEKRERELIDEIRSQGTQLSINFGSKVNTERALAQSAPTDGEDDRDDLQEKVDELSDRVDDLETDDDTEASGTAH